MSPNRCGELSHPFSAANSSSTRPSPLPSEPARAGGSARSASGARSLRVSRSAGTRADSPTPMIPMPACGSALPGLRGSARFVGACAAAAAAAAAAPAAAPAAAGTALSRPCDVPGRLLIIHMLMRTRSISAFSSACCPSLSEKYPSMRSSSPSSPVYTITSQRSGAPATVPGACTHDPPPVSRSAHPQRPTLGALKKTQWTTNLLDLALEDGPAVQRDVHVLGAARRVDA